MNQRQFILRKLQDGPVCGHTLLRAYVPRYAARINELREAGFVITTKPCDQHAEKSRVAEYALVYDPINDPVPDAS